VAMANLLGDVWQGGIPKWDVALESPEVQLHLYGKEEARPARKMGHLTACAETVQQALQSVVDARGQL